MCEYVCELIPDDPNVPYDSDDYSGECARRERVVRCRDCEFALVSKDAISCHGPIQAASIAMCAGKLVKPDGFCAWGKECDDE